MKASFSRPTAAVSPSASRLTGWLLSPPLVWMAVFVFLPLLLVLLVSVARRGVYGGIEWSLTLEHYGALLDPVYGRVLVRSVGLAAATTIVCLVLGFPMAYTIARAPVRHQGLWLLLVMIPFWTNFLVRTYAWMFILRTEGLLNTLVLAVGITDAPIEILYTDWAVLIGLVYGYLPFMVFPLYAAIERVDRALLEAARDLYASAWAVFWRVLWPLTRPGVIAGCLLVFIPSVGAFLTPDLLGGARSMMVGNLIQHEYLVVRNWPFGSAVSFVLMAVVMLGVMAFFRVQRMEQ